MTTKKENLDPKDFAIIFLLGSAFGTTTLIVSELSRVLFNAPLCLTPLSLKNILKTIILNGGTITSIVLIADAFGISEKEIKEDLGLDSDDDGKK